MYGSVVNIAVILSALAPTVVGRRVGLGVGEYDQHPKDGYNTIKYTGNSGPYTDRQAVGIDRDPPAGCEVDQVIMLHRHGTRYSDALTGAAIDEVVEKIKSALNLNGSLAFAENWETFVPSESYYELEFASGPYSGLADAYQRGAEYAVRYGHLWDGQSMVPIFAGEYQRVLDTGRKFGEGFMGYNYSTLAAVQLIDETAAAGANSVAPVCTPKEYTSCEVGDKTSLAGLMTPFVMPEFEVAANRLMSENPALNITGADIFELMSLSAFEIVARGRSQWADLFTSDEWVAFEYATSLLFYCYYGPGSPGNGQPIGSVFANATLTLLKQGPEEAGTMFWTFSHDAYVTAALSAMGVLIPSEKPTLDKVNFNYLKTYKITDIVPMAAHLTIERLSCSSEVSKVYQSANATTQNTTSSTNSTSNNTYVRLVLNEAVLPVDGCMDGPGYSCSLDSYDKFITENIKGFNYIEDCGVNSTLPQYLDFYWNWEKTTAHNYPNGTIPYQAKFNAV